MRNEYGHKTDPNCPWCHDRRCEQLYTDRTWPCEHEKCICPLPKPTITVVTQKSIEEIPL